jgi:hypothetical protein
MVKRAGKINTNKGSVLVAAVLLSFVSVILGITFLTFAVTLHNRISYEIADKQALYDCFAGAQVGLHNLMGGHHESGDLREFYEGNFTGFKFVGHHGIDYAPPFSPKVVGVGRSRYDGNDITKEVAFNVSQGESYANYLHLTTKERDCVLHAAIYFWVPDTLDGKVHSNDTIHIQTENDSPVFLERITTSARNWRQIFNLNHAQFLKGYGYQSPVIFDNQATQLRRRSEYNWGTYGHDSLTQVALSDSLIYYRKCGVIRVNGVDKIHCYPSDLGSQSVPIPQSHALFINGKVWVSAARGRVDRMDGEYPEDSFTDGSFLSNGFTGRLSIGSSDTMIIVDNLIYKHSRLDNSVPEDLNSCPDVLGLISERYIMVGKNVESTTYINAGLVALWGSFSVEDIYCSQPPGYDNEKQQLYVYGSVAQRNRGLLHISSLPPGHSRGFLGKIFHYDKRFHASPPPYFPIIDDGTMTYLEMASD